MLLPECGRRAAPAPGKPRSGAKTRRKTPAGHEKKGGVTGGGRTKTWIGRAAGADRPDLGRLIRTGGDNAGGRSAQRKADERNRVYHRNQKRRERRMETIRARAVSPPAAKPTSAMGSPKNAV